MRSRLTGTLLAVLMLATTSAYGQVKYGDFTVSELELLQVTETTQSAGDPAVLFGAPTYGFPFDGLAFEPSAFASECSTGGSDETESLLTMDINSPGGAAILYVTLAEAGDATLTAFPLFGDRGERRREPRAESLPVLRRRAREVRPLRG